MHSLISVLYCISAVIIIFVMRIYPRVLLKIVANVLQCGHESAMHLPRAPPFLVDVLLLELHRVCNGNRMLMPESLLFSSSSVQK